MRRTVNFTGRKRIPRSAVNITLSPNTDHVAEFKADLDLEDLNFPPDGRVFLEAYYKSSVMRFDLGQVGALDVPCSGHLDDIQSDVIFFRVKVVDQSQRIGRLLGVAEGISPGRDEEKQSILHTTFPDLGNRIWALDLEGPMPILQVNGHLDQGLSIREIVRSDPVFRSLVLPAVMREVLTDILVARKIREMDDEGWEGKWLRLASSLPNVTAFPDLLKRSPSDEDLAEWIEDVVDSFSRQHGFRKQFEAAMGELQ